jgi:hypothetical protein
VPSRIFIVGSGVVGTATGQGFLAAIVNHEIDTAVIADRAAYHTQLQREQS